MTSAGIAERPTVPMRPLPTGRAPHPGGWAARVVVGLLLGVAGTVVVAASWVLLVADRSGRRVDHALMLAVQDRFSSVQGGILDLLRLVNVVSVGLVLVVVAGIALARRRPGRRARGRRARAPDPGPHPGAEGGAAARGLGGELAAERARHGDHGARDRGGAGAAGGPAVRRGPGRRGGRGGRLRRGHGGRLAPAERRDRRVRGHRGGRGSAAGRRRDPARAITR